MVQQKAKPKARSRKTAEPTYKGAAKKTASGIIPKTDKQGELIKAISSSQQTIVFGPAGCKSGDTIVHYRRGKRNSSRGITLRDFVSKFNGLNETHKGRTWDKSLSTFVQSYNTDTGEVFYNKVEGAWATGLKHSVKITTYTKGEVEITLDDSVLLHDGTFKKASDVVVGDWLLCKGSMECPSVGSSVGKVNKGLRVTTEGLKFYSGGWTKLTVSNGTSYSYKRNHRARLVMEAYLNKVDLATYVKALQEDPDHTYLTVLDSGIEVHHIDGDVTNDELSNLQCLTKADHANLHGVDNTKNFNRVHTEVSMVKSVEDLGVIEVYDLTMAAPCPNFVVNDGIIAHNTGKTYVTATLAADMYLTKQIEKIVITRPMVSVGKDIGILPGELLDKVAPWALPVLDILIKHLGKASVEIALKSGNIEIAPLALMRGRSFDDAFIICDEAQNITTAELKMLLTRVGEGTTIVLNGDIQQTDLRGDSGLTIITNIAKKYKLPVPIVEFGLDDIVRSDICALWVRAFYKEGI